MGKEPPAAKAPKNLTDEMSFLDHLEELRWRIIKGLIAILGGVAVAYVFSDFLIDTILLGPAYADFISYRITGIEAVDVVFQNRRLPGQFFTFWGTMLIAGLVIGAPVMFYQLWKFVEPALEGAEKKKTRFTVFNITLLFFAGVSFGYFVLTPFAVQFFIQYTLSDAVRNDIDITAYFSIVSTWVLACGIIFQLPMVSYMLSRIGVLTPELMIKYRKVAIVMCFILAAFITPPDPVSQVIIAVPLLLLYQFSIYISRVVNRRRDREIWGAAGPPK